MNRASLKEIPGFGHDRERNRDGDVRAGSLHSTVPSRAKGRVQGRQKESGEVSPFSKSLPTQPKQQRSLPTHAAPGKPVYLLRKPLDCAETATLEGGKTADRKSPPSRGGTSRASSSQSTTNPKSLPPIGQTGKDEKEKEAKEKERCDDRDSRQSRRQEIMATGQRMSQVTMRQPAFTDGRHSRQAATSRGMHESSATPLQRHLRRASVESRTEGAERAGGSPPTLVSTGGHVHTAGSGSSLAVRSPHPQIRSQRHVEGFSSTVSVLSWTNTMPSISRIAVRPSVTRTGSDSVQLARKRVSKKEMDVAREAVSRIHDEVADRSEDDTSPSFFDGAAFRGQSHSAIDSYERDVSPPQLQSMETSPVRKRREEGGRAMRLRALSDDAEILEETRGTGEDTEREKAVVDAERVVVRKEAFAESVTPPALSSSLTPPALRYPFTHRVPDEGTTSSDEDSEVSFISDTSSRLNAGAAAAGQSTVVCRNVPGGTCIALSSSARLPGSLQPDRQDARCEAPNGGTTSPQLLASSKVPPPQQNPLSLPLPSLLVQDENSLVTSSIPSSRISSHRNGSSLTPIQPRQAGEGRRKGKDKERGRRKVRGKEKEPRHGMEALRSNAEVWNACRGQHGDVAETLAADERASAMLNTTTMVSTRMLNPGVVDNLKAPSQQKKIQLVEEDEVCPVCQHSLGETGDGGIVELVECSHCFCRGCIKKWLTEYNNTCPTCRTLVLPSADFLKMEQSCRVEGAGFFYSPHSHFLSCKEAVRMHAHRPTAQRASLQAAPASNVADSVDDFPILPDDWQGKSRLSSVASLGSTVTTSVKRRSIALERVPSDHFSTLGLTSSSRSLSQRFSIGSAFSPCHSNASSRSNSTVLSPGCLQDEGMAREQGCDLGAEGKSSGVQECHRVMGADDEERN
mmetsp:Transcript_6604/g.16483  ORF Transcript_6604/g.16483 Transcript_6604/m.16483 type:complete len:912 (-) Transcript_6604:134-2869(-)